MFSRPLPAHPSLFPTPLRCRGLPRMKILSHRSEPGALLFTLDDDEKALSYFGVGDGSEVRWQQALASRVLRSLCWD